MTQEWIDKQRARAEQTLVAETASGVIVVQHPGQKIDVNDRKHLKENFGILPGVEIKRLIDTDHAPPFAQLQRRLELQDSDLEDQLAYHLREAARVRAELAAKRGHLPPPPVPPGDDGSGDEGDDSGASADQGGRSAKSTRGGATRTGG